eukprot:scaffold257898_cov31-Tisochrysis_lutea.AAC.1
MGGEPTVVPCIRFGVGCEKGIDDVRASGHRGVHECGDALRLCELCVGVRFEQRADKRHLRCGRGNHEEAAACRVDGVCRSAQREPAEERPALAGLKRSEQLRKRRIVRCGRR